MAAPIDKIEFLPRNGGVLVTDIKSHPLKRHFDQFIVLKADDYDRTKSVFILFGTGLEDQVAFLSYVEHLKSVGLKIIRKLEVTPDIFGILIQADALEKKEKGAVVKHYKAEQKQIEYINGALANRCSDLHFRLNDDKSNLYHRIDGELRHIEDLFGEELSAFLETTFVSFSINRESEAYQPNTPQFSAYEGVHFLKKPYIKTSHVFEPHNVRVRLRKQRCPLDSGMMDEVWRVLIIDKESKIPSLDDLGFEPPQIDLIKQAIVRPQGLILVTGSTGSGKTVTLSSMLQLSANQSGQGDCIRTVENPVEITLPFARQRNIETADLFASSIEVYLRMDPDQMMVGEIRDAETAKAVVHGVLSGHPVYGTLHTSDAATVIPRLSKLDVDNITLGEKSFLNLICSQSLIRLLCANCKKRFRESKEAGNELVESQLQKANINSSKLYGPAKNGCHECAGIGFVGRSVLAEVVEITPKMKRMFYGGTIYEAFDHWLTLPPCKSQGNPPNKMAHGLLRMERGEVSPLSVIRSCGSLYEQAD